MILKDVFLLKNPQIISEDKGNKTLKIRGTFQRADEANANKRIYPKSVLESNVKRLQPLIENRALLGELDHPELESTRLSNAAVLITKLGLKGNEVIGEAEILNTPGGKIVKTLIEDKVTIGISSRGVGNLLPEAREDGVKFVGEDYKLITFDIVADPSTRGAYPQVCESKQSTYLDNVIKKAFGEEILIALAKNMVTESRKGLRHTQRVAAAVEKRADAGTDKPGDQALFYKKIQKQQFKDKRRGIVSDKDAFHHGDDPKKEDDYHVQNAERNVKRGKVHSLRHEAIQYCVDKILEGSSFKLEKQKLKKDPKKDNVKNRIGSTSKEKLGNLLKRNLKAKMEEGFLRQKRRVLRTAEDSDSSPEEGSYARAFAYDMTSPPDSTTKKKKKEEVEDDEI